MHRVKQKLSRRNASKFLLLFISIILCQNICIFICYRFLLFLLVNCALFFLSIYSIEKSKQKRVVVNLTTTTRKKLFCYSFYLQFIFRNSEKYSKFDWHTGETVQRYVWLFCFLFWKIRNWLECLFFEFDMVFLFFVLLL